MIKDKQNLILIALGLFLIVISNIVGHYFPPFSITVTPFLLPIIIVGMNYRFYKLNYILTVLYGLVLLIFNDLLIRFYAGGTHDQVGKAWIMLFSAIAFILSIISMFIFAFTPIQEVKSASKINLIMMKVASLILLSVITGFVYNQIIADI